MMWEDEFVPFPAYFKGTVLIRREEGVSGRGASSAYLNCITAWTKLDGPSACMMTLAFQTLNLPLNQISASFPPRFWAG